jgi:hypothetical protein
MTFLDILKFLFKYLITFYFCAAFTFIILSVGSNNKNYFIDAFSPINLFNQILSGNFSFIYYTSAFIVFVFSFNYLRRKKVDYFYGRGRPPWPK